MSDLLQQGIAALRAGDKARARRLFGRVIQENPGDEQAWLWLSGAMDTDRERLACLNEVLAINPANEMARRGVAALGKESPRQKPPQQLDRAGKPQGEERREQPAPPPSPTRPATTPGGEKRREQSAPPPPPTRPAPTPIDSPQHVTELLDHSKGLEQLPPEQRKALEGYVPLIIHDLTSGSKRPEELVERLTKRGFPRRAVEQLVEEIKQQLTRAPRRYTKRSP